MQVLQVGQDQPVQRRPGHPGQGQDAGRHEPVQVQGQGTLALHGLLDLLAVHRREQILGRRHYRQGAARQGLPARLWSHDRLRCCVRTPSLREPSTEELYADRRYEVPRNSTKTANVQEGDNVAIFGLGAVGLAVIQGCRVRKAKQIIAIDTNPAKEEWARSMGATDFINPTQLPEGKTIVDVLVEKTDGGCEHTLCVCFFGLSFLLFAEGGRVYLRLANLTSRDFSLCSDCTGNVNVMRQALEACHKGAPVSSPHPLPQRC